MLQLTKSEAHAEVLRRWREKPFKERKTYAQAEAFAIELEAIIDFETLGKRRQVIHGWLVREVDGFTTLGAPGRS